jgi:hypothetical protein
MCIKIIRAEDEIKYDISKPLEEQIVGAKQIVVDYEPNDSSLVNFLCEIERFCQTGVSRTFNIKVKHNNNVGGAKVKSRIASYAKKMSVNEVIKSLTLSYAQTDKKLEELSTICLIGNKNE